MRLKTLVLENFQGMKSATFDFEGQSAKIYARVAADAEPQYGDTAYLIVSGEEAGFFTNDAPATLAEDEGGADGDTETAAAPAVIAVKGRFLGGVDTSAQIAVIELFNQAQA